MLSEILIQEKEVLQSRKLAAFLQQNDYLVDIAKSFAETTEKLKSRKYAVLLSNCFLHETSDCDMLQKIFSLSPGIIVIYLSDYDNIQLAVDLIKNGAYHYMLKPIFPEKLLEILREALKEKQTTKKEIEAENAAKQPVDECSGKPKAAYIFGKSYLSQNMHSEIKLVAPTDYSVIIQGETGTGKESVARLIHENSTRKDKPFIAVDCGSLSKELAASELFGHEKGSFTGAVTAKQGAFESADGGTLFLDEIGNLAYEVQLYLLRALQEKIVRKVGSSMEKKVNVRVIVATNEDLLTCVKQKKFREDLYHRLNEFSIDVPALRDRPEDIPLFIDSFTASAAKCLNKNILGVTESALELIIKYNWPGNIRELKNMIKRAALLCKNGYISEQDLPVEILSGSNYIPEEINIDANLPEAAPLDTSANGLKDVTLKAEYFTIMNVLKKVRFNKSKAAELLNIDRKTLYNKLKRNI